MLLLCCCAPAAAVQLPCWSQSRLGAHPLLVSAGRSSAAGLGWALIHCWSRLGAHPLRSPGTPLQARDMAKEKAESIDARIADLSERRGTC